jgi:hypothetical protein
MYVVMIGNTRHSAWNTVQEALKQIKVLKEYGYKQVKYSSDPTVNTINGYYYC